jgi:hypothetical protein
MANRKPTFAFGKTAIVRKLIKNKEANFDLQLFDNQALVNFQFLIFNF